MSTEQIKPSSGLINSPDLLIAAPLTPELQVEREVRIQEFLTRAVDEVYPSREALANELRSGKRLSAYLGIDPTAPDMHIGHESQLHKLRRLQDLGHKVTLLIGDFTARIGDPSDKTATRQRLTHEQVLDNAKSYRNQAMKILNLDDPKNPVDVRFNSEWLGQLSFDEVVELAAEFTVQQISQRDMFQKRFKEEKPVYLHEFLYPLMQGWDSVVMDVDIEIGGSDQIFNMLVGRDLMKSHRGKSKFVVAGSLLVDPEGKKMGKTEGNMITLGDQPDIMFHKVMMWGDKIVPHALELCTDVPMEEVKRIDEALKDGSLDPVEGKKFLARTLVGSLHSPEAAIRAEAEYDKASKAEAPASIQEFPVTQGSSMVDILVQSGFAQTRNSARRLIQQGGVRINGQTVSDPNLSLDGQSGEHTLQVGKKTTDSFRKLVVD